MKKSIATLALLASMSVSVVPMVTFAQYGGGGGPPVGIFGISFGSGSQGSVLGASTTTLPINFGSSTIPGPSATCTLLLSDFLRYGSTHNDPAQVKILQQFLMDHGYAVDVNGVFDQKTLAAVKQFQLDHKDDVLAPWGITSPTGYVYKMTRWTINKMNCAALNEPFPTLP